MAGAEHGQVPRSALELSFNTSFLTMAACLLRDCSREATIEWWVHEKSPSRGAFQGRCDLQGQANGRPKG